ncbi:MAG: DNA translocase FtsK [Cytophagaceae bacterium]|nr:DNA translocase FtsK [Cytophagaceae bacterium]MDW8456059.1 DNA translocase FtsK 4TM domain-containing protein [Cytophagaceae bacterium]
MAENRYKSKNTNKKTAESSGPSGSKLPFDLDKIFTGNKPRLILGVSLLCIALFMFVSFSSYLYTGTKDQSIAESFLEGSVIETGKETKNILGLTGALTAYFFFYKLFGISSYLFIPILINYSVKILFNKTLLPLARLSFTNIFFILWLSFSFGYIVVLTDAKADLSILCGAVGFELATLSYALTGWGTVLLIVFAAFVFAVYFFNISSLKPQAYENNEQPHDQESNQTVDELSEPEDTEEETEFVLQKHESFELTNSDTEKQWEIGTSSKNIKTKDPEPLSFIIENTLEEEASPNVQTQEEKVVVVNDQFVELNEEDKEKDFAGIELENYDPTLDLPHYQYPTLELLNEYETSKAQVTREELELNKDKIVETLRNYSIGISSIKATIGPTVTLYEIIPEAGIRISKIKSLEDDIALSLSALGIRIIAPMPGKGTIGIEVPNKNKELVSVRSVLSTEKFLLTDKELPIAFGKTISNEVFVVDLAKMPHILMAGATGQGKSVGINILLTSLLFKKHPSQLKFVLIDPKKVEMSIYTKIERHFLAKLPDSEEAIITDTKKVIHTLNSLCIEMDNRYDLLKDAGCRNLKEYNKKFIERRLNPKHGHRFMPYIVLVIDELADLMITAGKEVETPIARLAQLARAIGIHLVVATQRPSVNVITGIIKANFPARLSFKVTSKVDSRTILDVSGAEQLVGQGDMLFSAGSEIIRLQCAFIDTPEVEKIVDFIGSQRAYEHAYYLPEFSDADMQEDNNKSGDFKFSERDKFFDEAARLVVSTQQGSTSLIQRKLKLGYNRAGRIIDQLESAGIVGPFEGSKAREVLIKDEISLEKLLDDLSKS